MSEEVDIFTYSFPCFVEGTKVLTFDGYKNIEEITSGDMVLTHNNRYKQVVKPMINKADHIYKMTTMCSDDIFVTEEHPFYVRQMSRVWNNNIRRDVRVFSDPEWVKTKDLSKSYYVGTAINKESRLPTWGGSVFEWTDGRRSRSSNVLSEKFKMSDFWWIIGRYIGDGWIRSGGGIIICCNFDETDDIVEKIKSVGFNYCIAKERTTNKIHLAFKEIGEFCEQFGRGALNKKITGDIINLPKHLLEGFLVGYMSADGCKTQGLNKASSISSGLIYGIGQCVAKVYSRPFSVYESKRKPTCTIEGRVVNQKTSYQIVWKDSTDIQDQSFYEDGYIWSPIRNLTRMEYEGLVYNIEVEDDNSYVVQNIIAHNCTDVSLAGRQDGLSKGSGTRSGLLWECEKFIEVNKPKVLLMENVKNLVQKKFINEFNEWCSVLEELGYKNYWKVLNAKNHGVPQNRERIFMVSIRKDVDCGKGFRYKLD